jgi:MYXO-CTERM domain-containing protein
VSVVSDWVLLAAAIAGIVLLRRRRAPLWIIVSPIVMVCLVTILGHGLARYRYAAEPSLMVLAAVAVERAIPARSDPAPASPSADPSG